MVGKPMPLIVFWFDWILLQLLTSFVWASPIWICGVFGGPEAR